MCHAPQFGQIAIVWSYSLVMSSSLGCSCLTLSSFRMCHCFILFNCYHSLLNLSGIPTRIGRTSVSVIFQRQIITSPCHPSVNRLRSHPNFWRYVSFNLDDIALLHLPGACTCFMGTAKAINSYRNHAKLIAPSSSGITTTSSLSSAYSLPNFTTRRLWVSIGISISSKHLSHGTTTTPSI